MMYDGGRSYAWNAEGRMSSSGVAFTYDGDGRRVKKSNGTLYWFGLGGEVLTETDLAGGAPTEFVYFNGARIARRDASGGIRYFFSDHLGTARVMTSFGGIVQQESTYYPFGGEQRVITDIVDNRYKFAGMYRDATTGLDHTPAREYSNTFGRWYSPDEFTGGPVSAYGPPDPTPPGALPYADILNPQSLNKYQYAGGADIVLECLRSAKRKGR